MAKFFAARFACQVFLAYGWTTPKELAMALPYFFLIVVVVKTKLKENINIIH